MGNIISNCCSNSLIFSTKNYFCGQQKRIYSRELILTGFGQPNFASGRRHYIRVNFARGEIFCRLIRSLLLFFTLENSYSRPHLIFLNGFTATNGASPSFQGSCLTHSNFRLKMSYIFLKSSPLSINSPVP